MSILSSISIEIGLWDPDKVAIEDYFASAYVLIEMVARETKSQIAGVTVVADISEFGFKHLRYLISNKMKMI